MIDGSVKNPNRITKLLLFAFEDPDAQWQPDGDDWFRWARPVYRKPQGSWAITEGFTRQKIWFIEKVYSETPTDPNDIDFPPWLQCYWDSQAGRWVVITPGSGGESGEYVVFTLEDGESSSGSAFASSGSSSGDDDALPDDCASRIPAVGPFIGRVVHRSCGMATVPGERPDGTIELIDWVGIMNDRDYRDIVGRTGWAVRMGGPDESGSDSGSGSGREPTCVWMIAWVDFWRVVKVVSDVIVGEKSITIKYRNLTVWDDCGLPDDVHEGIDCEESSSASGPPPEP